MLKVIPIGFQMAEKNENTDRQTDTHFRIYISRDVSTAHWAIQYKFCHRVHDFPQDSPRLCQPGERAAVVATDVTQVGITFHKYSTTTPLPQL